MTFTVALRGYDRGQVETFFAEVDKALADGPETARAAAAAKLETAGFTQVLRGYAVDQVDAAIQERLRQVRGEPGPAAAPPDFTYVLRGYDRHEVDRLLAQADEAVADESLRTAARAALATATFTERFRGYHRPQVDAEIARRLRQL